MRESAWRGAMSVAAFTVVVLTFLGGCMQMPSSPQRLQGTRWIVTALDGQAVEPDATPSLAIGENGRASGSDGCNRFVGGLAFDEHGGATAEPTGAISTRMACPGPKGDVSRRYNALRSAVTAWHFEGAALVLATADGRTITLRRGD